MLSFFLLGSPASAEESAALASDVADILSVLNIRLNTNLSSIESDLNAQLTDLGLIRQGIQYIRSDISTDLSTINGNITDVESYLRQINQKLPSSLPNYSTDLASISQTLSSFKSANHSDLSGLLSGSHSDALLLSNMLSRVYSKIPSTIPVAKDELAGNPWWASNSIFAAHLRRYAGAYPTEDPDRAYTYSFPQFMSAWSSKLITPQNTWLGNTANQANWNALWGVSSISRWGSGAEVNGPLNGYTWFDWVSDAMRSNWVLQASSLAALRGVSNAVGSSSSSSVSSVDVLAGNPWWSTNSAFARNWAAYSLVYPQAESGLSFPEAFSAFLAGRTSTSILRSSLWDDFGIGGINQGRLYTFEDWLAEAIKSNLVLTTSTSVSNLAAELYDAGYDTSSADSITNTPLPQYSLPAVESIPEAESALESGEQTVTDLIESLPKPSTGGSPEIVVIPEFNVGGIHVREYRASLDSSIVPVCRSVMSFLYAVMTAAYLLTMAKSEYVYYATLGRHWGKYA